VIGVRPLTARALKSAIDSLRPRLPGSKVLDLFAGQGRFGIAALCEGASYVVFVESNIKTCMELKEVLVKKKLGAVSDVVRGDVFSYLSRQAPTSMNLVFADPPFPSWSIDFSMQLFSAVAKVVSIDSIFLVKAPKKMLASCQIKPFRALKQSSFGESSLLYFEYADPYR